MICKLCDKLFTPNSTNHQTYCGAKCSRTVRKVLDSYASNRLSACPVPKGVIMKVLKNYNIPTFGVGFDDRGQSRRFGASVFDK